MSASRGNARATTGYQDNTLIELKTRLEVALSRLNDQETQRSGVEEIRDFLQYISADWFSTVINSISEAGENLKPSGRCEAVKLLAMMAEVHGEAVLPTLPRMLQVVVSRFQGADLHLQAACKETVFRLARALVVEVEGSPIFGNLLKPLFTAVGEFSKPVQVGAALCIGSVIQASPSTVIRENLPHLCSRLVKYLNVSEAMAKPQLLSACIYAMHSVEGQDFDEVLPAMLPCLAGCLASSSRSRWQTRKQAIEVLQTIGDNLELGQSLDLPTTPGEMPTPLQRHIMATLETVKDDKVGAVRAAAKDVTMRWTAQYKDSFLAGRVSSPTSASVCPGLTDGEDGECEDVPPVTPSGSRQRSRSASRSARQRSRSASRSARKERHTDEGAASGLPTTPRSANGEGSGRTSRDDAIAAAIGNGSLKSTKKAKPKPDRPSIFKGPTNENFFKSMPPSVAPGPVDAEPVDGLEPAAALESVDEPEVVEPVEESPEIADMPSNEGDGKGEEGALQEDMEESGMDWEDAPVPEGSEKVEYNDADDGLSNKGDGEEELTFQELVWACSSAQSVVSNDDDDRANEILEGSNGEDDDAPDSDGFEACKWPYSLHDVQDDASASEVEEPDVQVDTLTRKESRPIPREVVQLASCDDPQPIKSKRPALYGMELSPVCSSKPSQRQTSPQGGEQKPTLADAGWRSKAPTPLQPSSWNEGSKRGTGRGRGVANGALASMRYGADLDDCAFEPLDTMEEDSVFNLEVPPMVGHVNDNVKVFNMQLRKVAGRLSKLEEDSLHTEGKLLARIRELEAVCESQNDILAAQRQRIQSQDRLLKTHEEQLKRQAHQIQEQEHRLHGQKRHLQNHRWQVQQLDQQLDQHDQQLKEYDQLLVDHDDLLDNQKILLTGKSADGRTFDFRNFDTDQPTLAHTDRPILGHSDRPILAKHGKNQGNRSPLLQAPVEMPPVNSLRSDFYPSQDHRGKMYSNVLRNRVF